MEIKCLRRPKQEVIQAIVEIVKELTGSWFTKTVYLDTEKDLLYQDSFCVYEGDELISFIVFTCWDGDIHITLMGTRQSYHHKGYGSYLMKAFCEYIKELNFDKIVVLTVPPDINPSYENTILFYKKQGFKFVKRYNELWRNGALEYIKYL